MTSIDGTLSEGDGLISLTEECGEVAPRLPQERAKAVRRGLVVLAVLATVASVALLGKSNRSRTQRSGGDVVGLFGLWGAGSSINCYVDTGGTCSVHPCRSERGSTCKYGKCVCENSCAGPDGKCYPSKQNLPVALHFALANVNWPRYGMYVKSVSATNQLKVTNAPHWLNNGKDYFSLYHMAGTPAAADKAKFLLQSTAWPTVVAQIAGTGTTAISRWGAYAIDFSKGKGPDALALSVCWHDDEKAIAFGDLAATKWAYLKHGAWRVFAYEGKLEDAGKGALWKVDPPFTPEQHEQLPSCSDFR